MAETESKEYRELFTPSGVVSWSAQLDRCARLAHRGLDVRLHWHGQGRSCVSKPDDSDGSTPIGWCTDIVLTPTTGEVSVIPVSNTAAETPKDD